MDSMNKLQNQFYNAVIAALGVNNQYFQFYSSGTNLQTDADLWGFQNQIPPYSLTWNPLTYSASPFFSQYTDLINELSFPESKFKSDIGSDNYDNWIVYLNSLKPSPAPNTIPNLFQKWALINCPSKLSIGVSDLNAMIYVTGGQQQLKPYEGQPPIPVDFTNNMTDLKAALNKSPQVKFAMDSSSASGDVSGTWTGGVDLNYFGLWTDSSTYSLLNRKFSDSDVAVSFTLEKVTSVPFGPGKWYDSGLLHMTYAGNTEPLPWPTDPDPSWDDLFGNEGTMNYINLATTVADGISFELRSNAIFTEDEQNRIEENLGNGIWPLYDSTMNYTLSFDELGMLIKGTKAPGNPTLIGSHVSSIQNYLISG
ncbi:MAG: hypothetical protein ACJA1C_003379 [Crocinitomicaceae bacterium]|jgi:hypothetical protein